MNLIEMFQDLMSKVPELLQPLIVAAAGAVPFVEGEGAPTIGIFGGLPPVVAVIAAIVGNFACVAALVLLGAGARKAVVSRRRERRLVTAGQGGDLAADSTAPVADDRGAARSAKFQKAFERYGVPGVSLLGPLLLPTQFTAVMLAAAGVGKARILLWQGLAIVLWTTAVALVATGVVSVVV